MGRKAIPKETQWNVLTEAGFRCSVPTCRGILAIDIHHLVQVSEEGSNEPSNLIALCPTCHALHHRGVIPKSSLFVWKSLLVSLMQAFDKQAIDDLLFLDLSSNDNNEITLNHRTVALSGDGVLKFSRLIASGLVSYSIITNNNWQLVTYTAFLTPKGKNLVSAWKAGDRSILENINTEKQ